MSDAEIMVILILFHSRGFRCFNHYDQEYVCKHLTHLSLIWNSSKTSNLHCSELY